MTDCDNHGPMLESRGLLACESWHGVQRGVMGGADAIQGAFEWMIANPGAYRGLSLGAGSWYLSPDMVLWCGGEFPMLHFEGGEAAFEQSGSLGSTAIHQLDGRNPAIAYQGVRKCTLRGISFVGANQSYQLGANGSPELRANLLDDSKYMVEGIRNDPYSPHCNVVMDPCQNVAPGHSRWYSGQSYSVGDIVQSVDFPTWAVGAAYQAGDIVYDPDPPFNRFYVCTSAHVPDGSRSQDSLRWSVYTGNYVRCITPHTSVVFANDSSHWTPASDAERDRHKYPGLLSRYDEEYPLSSNGLNIDLCSLYDAAVGLMITPCGPGPDGVDRTQNGEQVVLRSCTFSQHWASFATGQSQTRGAALYDCSFANFRVAIDSRQYGPGGNVGTPPNLVANCTFGRGRHMFNVSTSGGGMMVLGGHAEDVGGFGYIETGGPTTLHHATISGGDWAFFNDEPAHLMAQCRVTARDTSIMIGDGHGDLSGQFRGWNHPHHFWSFENVTINSIGGNGPPLWLEYPDRCDIKRLEYSDAEASAVKLYIDDRLDHVEVITVPGVLYGQAKDGKSLTYNTQSAEDQALFQVGDLVVLAHGGAYGWPVDSFLPAETRDMRGPLGWVTAIGPVAGPWRITIASDSSHCPGFPTGSVFVKIHRYHKIWA